MTNILKLDKQLYWGKGVGQGEEDEGYILKLSLSNLLH